MRRFLVAGLGLGTIVGCGGGSEPTPPPPPPGATPASIAVQGGDGQEAEPGKAVSTAPRVIVKDASGHPITGVTVTFTADSGGGSVGSATATTASDGSASTAWTLGPSEGPNSLLASASNLAPVRFHATGRITIVPLIDTSSVPSSGGDLVYAKAGDSLSGVRLTVFGGSFQGPARFHVSVDQVTKVPLPANVRQLGPAFVIGMDSGFAAQPMALRLPARHQDEVVAAFFYDPATGALEGVPLIARDDSSIVVMTSHFRSDHLLANAKATSASRRLARVMAPAFGQVLIVGVTAPRTVITTPVTTGFTVGVDNWEYTNLGTNPEPGGICSGMSASELYYYANLRGQGSLFGHYDTFANLEWDDPVGEAIATRIQHQSNWSLLWQNIRIILNFWLPGAAAAQYDEVAYQSLALTMSVTHQPQYLAIFDLVKHSGHAIVAYGVDNGTIPFADPNYPTTPRNATYDLATKEFQPITLSINARAGATSFPDVFFVGTSATINTVDIAAAFTAATQGTIVDSAFPQLVHEYFDVGSSKWLAVPAGDTIATTHRQLALRTRCLKGCPLVTPRFDRITSVIRDTTNTVRGLDPAYSDTAAIIVFGHGPGSFRLSWEDFVAGFPAPPDSMPEIADYGSTYAGEKLITILTPSFAISPAPVNAEPTVDVNLKASSSGYTTRALATSTFVWDFHDGTPTVANLGDSTVTHKWQQSGTYVLTAELRDSTGSVINADTTQVTVELKAAEVWQFQSVTVTSFVPPPSLATAGDSAENRTVSQAFAALQQNPSASGLQVYGQPTGGAGCLGIAVVVLFPNGQWSDVIPDLKHEYGFVGVCGDSSYTGNLTLGPLGSGTLVGSAASKNIPDTILIPGGSINAQMNGKTLSGSFVLLYRYSTGMSSYTISFSGTQKKP